MTHVSSINSQYFVFDITIRKRARAQPRTLRPTLVLGISLTKPRRICTQYRLGIALRQLYLLMVQPIPILRKSQVSVRLQKVRLASPELTRKVSRGSRSITFRLIHVECTNLPALAILCVVWIGTELFNAIDIRGTITDLSERISILILPFDLHTRPTRNTNTKTILHNRANEQLVRIRRRLERLTKRFPQQMIAIRSQRHEDGSILPNGKYRSITVGVLEGCEEFGD
mmetsp:Transcript_14496/g.31448  ORF Transcript_14496/g.31448 Transcript_14496/m.31448 type:complete len:228 (+) Transcript_14496:564-1247(+)